MDTGLWTLKCQRCGAIFSIELTAGERIIDYAREHPCPKCHEKPVIDGDGKEPVGQWHHVIGFRAAKDRPR